MTRPGSRGAYPPIYPSAMTQAGRFLASLKGRPLQTVTGRPNRILELKKGKAYVSTTRSPKGKPVPIEWIQDAIDRLESDGEIEISVDSVGHRSAFVGAVLRELPGAEIVHGATPPR